jgi:predicted ATP-grasp superfamily ATP-dependent carboligase
MGTVLCTDGVTSKALAITRSLGARGIKVITADKNRWHPSGFSKYSAKSLCYPDPKTQPERFVAWLLETIVQERVEVLYVLDDDTLLAVMPHRKQLEALCRLTLPPEQGYAVAADKGKTMQLAKKLGIPCPLTVEPNFAAGWNREELLRLTAPMSYPLVLKPKFSSGSRGVRVVHHVDELLLSFPLIHEEYPNPLIQECIPQGTKYDVCLFYGTNRQPGAVFVQKQIRNYPIPRGPSTVHESAELPEAVAYSTALLDALHWYSVADVEFMIDPRDGIPKLMEINPRYWSSTHLAIRSGVDFPWLCYRAAMGEAVEPVTSYTIGKMGRSLLPGDVLHYISNPDRGRMHPPFWNRLPDDTVSAGDPWPTVGFFLSALRYSLNPLRTWKLLIRR